MEVGYLTFLYSVSHFGLVYLPYIYIYSVSRASTHTAGNPGNSVFVWIHLAGKVSRWCNNKLHLFYHFWVPWWMGMFTLMPLALTPPQMQEP